MINLNELAERIAAVRENIERAAARVGRSTDEICLVAVSKTMPADRVVAVAEMGLTDFGENRVQEAEVKIPIATRAMSSKAASTLRWHLIGHLQSNKARQAIRVFSIIESVDSVGLARTLDRLARDQNRVVDVLLEVNVGQEESKFGFPVAELLARFHEVQELSGLKVRGLMTVAPALLDQEAVRPYFRQLRLLRDQLETEIPRVQLPELSMGMTGDYPIAIEEGATIVRVGRAIFGERI